MSLLIWVYFLYNWNLMAPTVSLSPMTKMAFICGRCFGSISQSLIWPLRTGTCEWIFMSGAEQRCALVAASSHSLLQGPLKNTKLQPLRVHTLWFCTLAKPTLKKKYTFHIIFCPSVCSLWHRGTDWDRIMFPPPGGVYVSAEEKAHTAWSE